MNKSVGIRFKTAGKIYDFDCGAFVLKQGDSVIVETDQGLGFGTVAMLPKSYDETKLKKPLKKIFRLATEKDFAQLDSNRRREKEAHIFCQECIRKLRLNMNLFAVESTFDGGKMTYFFTAEARVDFRELVKMIAKRLNIRVEMRQVGIRNQAKMCGGLGRCGRELCCSTFIDKFDPVSIRMAKDQGLSLNPTKISGQCGRLMCCLTYEHKTYSELKKKFPKIGKSVNTLFGRGKVLRHSILDGNMVVRLEDPSEEKEITLDEIVKDGAQAPDENEPSRGEEQRVNTASKQHRHKEQPGRRSQGQKDRDKKNRNVSDRGVEKGQAASGRKGGDRSKKTGGRGRRGPGRRADGKHPSQRGKQDKTNQ